MTSNKSLTLSGLQFAIRNEHSHQYHWDDVDQSLQECRLLLALGRSALACSYRICWPGSLPQEPCGPVANSHRVSRAVKTLRFSRQRTGCIQAQEMLPELCSLTHCQYRWRDFPASHPSPGLFRLAFWGDVAPESDESLQWAQHREAQLKN